MCGHVYLSPSDKQSEKYKYYVMRSMVEIATDYGVKKFRKQKYKNVQDLANKMNTYYSNVIQALEQYTGGYPYKKGA